LSRTFLAIAATARASATLRASGFSHAKPISSPVPRSRVWTISSTLAMRAWLGPHSHNAWMSGSATIAAMDLYALAGPTSSSRASRAVPAAFFAFGLHTPMMSQSRTC
jgi:hypothetical protein